MTLTGGVVGSLAATQCSQVGRQLNGDRVHALGPVQRDVTDAVCYPAMNRVHMHLPPLTSMTDPVSSLSHPSPSTLLPTISNLG